ncbi:uncharacterized protein ARMOST_09940 [Armillaria ostoyae]|uniref:Zn(2)-C6 fungal-type domain-containing protein n=1 Tax=Armillaria ostoyae TaxID=47428 RepID=A0A284RCW8_ARMOS|nr:uncharacterized protein ARMOST_09940 [Armillaria ostoyae]
MSNSVEYCQSATPKPYESAPMPEGLTSEQYKVFTEEHAAAEEKYEEAIGAYDEWKAAKVKEAQLEKLKVDKEVQAEKLKKLQELEEEWKVAEKKEQEKQAALLKEKQEAEDKQKKLDELKKAKEEKEAAKRLRKEQKKVEKAVKAAESSKGKGTAVAAELLREERETDTDTEGEQSEASKAKALQKLREKQDGKWKAMAPAVSTAEKNKKRKQATKSTSIVESEAEEVPGPSKRVKMEVSGPVEDEEELKGNKRCMHCRQDSAHCFARPASEKSNRRRTCSRCKTKKAACSFNKGTLSALTIGSEEVAELLQKLAHTVKTLSNKVDILTGQVVSLRGRVDDLVDDFCSEAIDSPEELISDMEEWQALCMELKELGSVNSEALWRVMVWRLDEDMAQLRAKGPAEPEKMNAGDPYEVADCEFWYGLRSLDKMAEMKLKRDLFQATRNEFYKLEGRRSKWQFWKDYLQKHNCNDFLVEDLDLREKVLDGKVRKSWKLYRKDLGIPALDSLFILDGDSAGGTTSEDEESDEGEEESESVESDKNALAGGTEDVEMKEVADVVGAMDA